LSKASELDLVRQLAPRLGQRSRGAPDQLDRPLEIAGAVVPRLPSPAEGENASCAQSAARNSPSSIRPSGLISSSLPANDERH
jgi:hypothetical protein